MLKTAIKQVNKAVNKMIRQDLYNPYSVILATEDADGKVEQDDLGQLTNPVTDGTVQAHSQAFTNVKIIRSLGSDLKVQHRRFFSLVDIPAGSFITPTGLAQFELIESNNLDSHFEAIGKRVKK